MKFTKKFVSLLLVIMMCVAALPGALAEEKDYSETITFTMACVDAGILGQQNDGTESAVWTWLKDKFNVEFEMWNLTWSDYIDQTRIWINTGSAPDIMMLDVAAPRYGEFLDWVDAGVLQPYANYENYPNLAARMEKMSTGKKFIVDGELYAWPAYLDTAEFDYAKIIGYKYRTDWAKQTGMYKEDGIYTWDEWWTMLDKVKELQLGGEDTIPVMGQSNYAFPWDWTRGISPYMLSFTQVDGQWVWGASLPETSEALQFIKDKYDAGIIYKDQPIDQNATNQFAAGKLFAALYDGFSTGGFMGDKITFEDANPGLVYEDIFEIALVKAPDGKIYTEQGSDQWSQTAMNANMSEAQVERWMDMLDYLASDEGYYVRNYGIPGVDWEWDGDKAVCLWEPDAEGKYTSPYQNTWPWARIAGCNDNFSNYAPDQPAKVQQMIIDRFSAYLSEDAVIIPSNADVDFFTDEDYLMATSGLEAASWAKIAELLIQDDFVAEWESWVAEKLFEVQPALDALNEAFPAE